MLNFKNVIVVSILSILAIFMGCSDLIETHSLSLSQAEKKLRQLSKKESGSNVLTKTVGKTTWVYLPIDFDIFSPEATKKSSREKKQKPRKFSILYLNGFFEKKTFFIEYDVISTTKAPEGPGYSTKYTEEYTKKKHGLTYAIFQSYANVGAISGDIEFNDPMEQLTHKELIGYYVEENELPSFFVVVIADIKSGLETEEIFHFFDLKRYMSSALPQEEYTKRIISKLSGNKSIIKDKTGKHLEYKDITWGEFLTKQILHRIRFKYQQSDFPPTEDAESEILNIVAKATEAYGFDDFTSIKLHNLRSDTEYTFEPSQLETFTE